MGGNAARLEVSVRGKTDKKIHLKIQTDTTADATLATHPEKRTKSIGPMERNEGRGAEFLFSS